MSGRYSYYVESFELADRPRRFLDTFGVILQHSNYGLALELYARTSNKCSRCAAACHVYQASGQASDIPCQRSELLLRIYRRYFTLAGLVRARLWSSFTLTDDYLDRMAEEMYRCSACRRCKMSCPMGIDHGLITHLARWILAELGMVPKALVVSVREQLEGKTGNTSAIPVIALKDTLAFLEEEFLDNYGVAITFPLDVQDAEYLFFPAVSDFLIEPDTLMGNAAVMAVTGGSWTIGTGYFDGINYGLFYSDRMLSRIIHREIEEARRLKTRKIMIGECGHASRSAKSYVPTYGGGKSAPPVVNIMEYTCQALLEGRLSVRAKSIRERVTYHDPCNIARSGWLIDQPREILKAISADFVEMTPHGTLNYCCGGGGGTVSVDEIRSYRTGVAGKIKAEQIRRTGAKYLVAPCANCKKQLREVCEDHGLTEVEVVGLHDLVLKAIEFPDHLKRRPCAEKRSE
ncbi:(Fe-S)-binding protein [bacterium]|nr:(Fe-S)-binding protein [bacterium]